MKHRTLLNGDLVFDDPAPANVPYYDKDPDNPNLFHPAFVPCRLRVLATYKKACGSLGINYFCKKFSMIVNGQICEECDHAVE